MPDFVPFARSRREVMTLDRYIEFIGEFLQLAFPQTHGRTIAVTTIRGNEQTLCQRITNAAYVLPLAANGLHGERRRIVVDPDVHPARVGAKIINSIGCGAAEFLDQKVVHTNLFRVALGALFAAGVLESAHEFLVLRVDGEHRLVLGQAHPDRLVDEAELSVHGLNCRRLPWACRLNFRAFNNSPTTIWLISCPSLFSLAAKRRRLLHVQRRGDIGSPRVSLDKRVQMVEQLAIGVCQRFPPASRTANAPLRHSVSGASRSFGPRPIVLAALRVTRATAAIPR